MQPTVAETAAIADAARVVDALHDALAKGDRDAGTFKEKAIDSITLETMVQRCEVAGWWIVHIHGSSRNAKK